MREKELLQRKIQLEKQWLWMLTNLLDEELSLPKGVSRQEAVNKALDRVNYYLNQLKALSNEKD